MAGAQDAEGREGREGGEGEEDAGLDELGGPEVGGGVVVDVLGGDGLVGSAVLRRDVGEQNQPGSRCPEAPISPCSTSRPSPGTMRVEVFSRAGPVIVRTARKSHRKEPRTSMTTPTSPPATAMARSVRRTNWPTRAPTATARRTYETRTVPVVSYGPRSAQWNCQVPDTRPQPIR